jgi:hypothetical protein
MDKVLLADNHPLAITARAAAIACGVVIIVASLGPSSWLPHLLYSNNLEHFAAFYVVALAFSAARYRTPLVWVVRDVALLATVLEAAKWILPGPRKANFEHWIADLGGILALAAPMVIASFRRSFAPSRAVKDSKAAA